MSQRLSSTALFVLQALARGHRFGFDVMDATGLPSGTVYPILRRLESLALLESDWERRDPRGMGRPRRRYYRLTRAGRGQLGEARSRFDAVSGLFAPAPGSGRA